MQIKLSPITNSNTLLNRLKYKRISLLGDYIPGMECILVKTLHPDYYLLFNNIKAIVTENGSKLSHLAILAREWQMPIYLSEEPLDNLPLEGNILINPIKNEAILD